MTGSASSPNGCGVAKFNTDTLFPTLVNGQVEDLEYTLGQLLSPAGSDAFIPAQWHTFAWLCEWSDDDGDGLIDSYTVPGPDGCVTPPTPDWVETGSPIIA